MLMEKGPCNRFRQAYCGVLYPPPILLVSRSHFVRRLTPGLAMSLSNCCNSEQIHFLGGWGLQH